MPLNFGAPNPATDGWALNEEAIANLGYMQLKKTHDAAMVLIQQILALVHASIISLATRRAVARPSRWCSATLPTTTVYPP